MQRRAPSIRHRGGTSDTFSQFCRLTDGCVAHMKTSEGLSLPTLPCSQLRGRAVANPNQWERVAREKLDGQALKLTLTFQEVTQKFGSWSCVCAPLVEY